MLDSDRPLWGAILSGQRSTSFEYGSIGRDLALFELCLTCQASSFAVKLFSS